MRTRADHKLEALAAGLRRAVTGETEAERLAGAEAVLAALARSLGRHASASRGRRPVHDREWALSQLTALSASPDGVPADQASTCSWLEGRFRDEELAVPGETWLKQIERVFRKRALIRSAESAQKFRSSAALQAAFGDERSYLDYCETREKLERRWLHDAEIRCRHKTAADFLASVFEAKS